MTTKFGGQLIYLAFLDCRGSKFVYVVYVLETIHTHCYQTFSWWPFCSEIQPLPCVISVKDFDPLAQFSAVDRLPQNSLPGRPRQNSGKGVNGIQFSQIQRSVWRGEGTFVEKKSCSVTLAMLVAFDLLTDVGDGPFQTGFLLPRLHPASVAGSYHKICGNPAGL